MSASSHPVIRHLRAAGAEGAPDALLLRRFVAARDEAAFAAIVERHGPMVLGVARRAVGDEHLAEDVCQATFLVLARKAAGVKRGESLASWLHGTAVRLASKARAKAARATQPDYRPRAEPADPAEDITWRELRRVLDAELARLPERYRLPLVLCYLEGLTRDEAAVRLGWGVQQVKGMLERGRERLRLRLLRRGIALSAALAVPLLAERAVAIPPLLAVATIDAGMKLAAGAALADCGVGPAVTTLVQLGTQTMMSKLTKPVAAAAALTLLGAGLWAFPGDDKPAQNPPEEKPAAAGKRVEFKTLNTETQVYVLAFSGDSKTFYASPGVQVVHSWRTADWEDKKIERISARFAGLGPDSKLMGVESTPKEGAPGRTMLNLIDWETGAGRWQTPVETALVVQAALTPDGAMVAVATLKETTLVDSASGRIMAKIDHSGQTIQTLAFSGDNQHLAIGYGVAEPGEGKSHGGGEIWEVGKMRQQPAGGMRMTVKFGTQDAAIARVVFSPDGKTLAGVAPNGPTIHLWDVNGNSRPRTLKRPDSEHPHAFLAAAFTADGKTLVTNWRDKTEQGVYGVALYDVASGKEVEVLHTTNKKPQGGAGGAGEQLRKFGTVTAVAVSPDGKLIAAGDAEGNIKVWRRE